ncbi:MAG: 3'(2'),5'-bisphosphate nucleotidase CysQ [Gemmatimonadota bacterium]
MTYARVEDLALATAAAWEAGRRVMENFRAGLAVTMKSPGQPVTQADLDADAILRQRLLADRPDYGWLSEETVDTPDRLAHQRVWIVDPIDGTRSFIAGRAEFSISVGLAEEGEAVVGVVLNPATGELFTAVRGGGAWGARGPDGERRRLAVRQPPPAAPGAILASRSEIAARTLDGLGEARGTDHGWRTDPLGSTAYKLARVAAGDADAFVSLSPKGEWDVCAGILLVEEAGGRASDGAGDLPAYNQPDPHLRGVIAGSSAAWELLRERVRALPDRRSE